MQELPLINKIPWFREHAMHTLTIPYCDITHGTLAAVDITTQNETLLYLLVERAKPLSVSWTWLLISHVSGPRLLRP